MALNFPNSPTNAQSYVDPNGHTWVYETATNSWTAQGAPLAGMVYVGSIDITKAPPTGATTGSVFTVSTGGTPNAGFHGLPTTVAVGSQVIYDGAKWQLMSSLAPDATATVKGIDKQKWSRTGTVLSPTNAGDVVNISAGTAALPGLTPVGDPDTGIYSPGADQWAVATKGTGRLYIASNGTVGVGTGSATPEGKLHVSEGSSGASASKNSDTLFLENSGQAGITIGTPNNTVGQIRFADPESDAAGRIFYEHNNDAMVFSASNTERVRIDGPTGRLLVGTTSTSADVRSVFQARSGDAAGHANVLLASGTSSPAADDGLGFLSFSDATHTPSAWIHTARDGGTWSGSSKPTRLKFSTTPDGTATPVERLRIAADGRCVFNAPAGVNGQVVIEPIGFAQFHRASGSAQSTLGFFNGGNSVGEVRTSTTATVYLTTSDYRLKENVTPVSGAITRLQQLKPSRFNFIADPGTVVDGFIAHEAQAVVPECITGTKDEVDADGNPIYQGIDQSKLVPLLTAALQEAIGEIESLKARLTAAGI